MNDQDGYTSPEPIDDGPRRFTPLLMGAVAIGALAVLIVLYLVFFGGGGGRPSPTPTNGSNSPIPSGVSTTPSRDPSSSASPDGSIAAPDPSAAAGLAETVCAEALPPYDELEAGLVAAFRGYCAESVAAVLVGGPVDPDDVTGAGWAFTGASPDLDGAGGVAISRVFLSVGDERRVRRYLVSHGEEDGATIVGQPVRVRASDADLIIFRWARGGG